MKCYKSLCVVFIHRRVHVRTREDLRSLEEKENLIKNKWFRFRSSVLNLTRWEQIIRICFTLNGNEIDFVECFKTARVEKHWKQNFSFWGYSKKRLWNCSKTYIAYFHKRIRTYMYCIIYKFYWTQKFFLNTLKYSF